MSDLRFTIGDVLASCDVLTDVTDYSDTMTPEQCVEFRIACEAVAKAAKEAVDFLNMQFVKVSELDVIRDGKRYYVSRKKDNERFDHDAIEGRVIDEATEHAMAESEETDGEWDGRIAARWAAHMMRELYVSDATKAKIGALNKYEIPCDKNHPETVRSWQPGDKYVAVVPAGGET